MTASSFILKRARSQIGHLRYYLGAGGRDPKAGNPGDELGRCDCSGFAAWCLGIDRKQPTLPGWGWLSTDSMVDIARKPNNGWLLELPRPEPGCLVVYPGLYGGGRRKRIGHAGIVSQVPAEWPGPFRVIHCSAGNQKKLGYAVAETDGFQFTGRGAMFLRFLR